MENSIDKTQVNLKVWRRSRNDLRLLFALTGESMTSIIHRLVLAELKRVKSSKDDNSQGV
ncbi:hypothetical protein LCGC14_2325800 [marine sediment metagenome]|uniref:Uncharacterized protein n=1 Tax=marine sediment metagenome TaxID=412755 RepID=A0A0F9CH29_9ZZZZ